LEFEIKILKQIYVNKFIFYNIKMDLSKNQKNKTNIRRICLIFNKNLNFIKLRIKIIDPHFPKPEIKNFFYNLESHKKF